MVISTNCKCLNNPVDLIKKYVYNTFCTVCDSYFLLLFILLAS